MSRRRGGAVRWLEHEPVQRPADSPSAGRWPAAVPSRTAGQSAAWCFGDQRPLRTGAQDRLAVRGGPCGFPVTMRCTCGACGVDLPCPRSKMWPAALTAPARRPRLRRDRTRHPRPQDISPRHTDPRRGALRRLAPPLPGPIRGSSRREHPPACKPDGPEVEQTPLTMACALINRLGSASQRRPGRGRREHGARGVVGTSTWHRSTAVQGWLIRRSTSNRAVRPRHGRFWRAGPALR